MRRATEPLPIDDDADTSFFAAKIERLTAPEYFHQMPARAKCATSGSARWPRHRRTRCQMAEYATF